ncbi:MAG: pyrroline-5-carboxylate reductase [Thermodesulfobacteriota bacterium]
MAYEGRIGILGGGNMGSALAKGLIAAGTYGAGQVVVAEKLAATAEKVRRELGVEVAASPAGLPPVDTLVVAVKQADLAEAVQAARTALKPESLVITLVAGIPLARLAALLPPGQPLARAMPNMPALVGRGVSALAPAQGLAPELLERAQAVFAAVGRVVVVKEPLMDAVTALSGSGPGYVFLFIEALADAGVAQGLDRATALTLAAGTVAGAAELLLQVGQHPAQLKDMVASPGGTTIAGLHALERGGLRGVIMDAVAAATARGRELGA